jgi:phage tail-like protein
MARSSTKDPIEKFRFKLTVVAVSPSLNGVVETLSSFAAENNDAAKNFAVLLRMGFSEITLPRSTISEIPYRENIDGYRFQKTPGLVRYEPVTLKRGVTNNRDLYDWLRLVNDELVLLSTANELTGNVRKGPRQSENFRKDVIIEVLDREGNPVKGWYLFNAWPTTYKPGDDLNAQSEEKLVEELALTYELFLEVDQGIKGFLKEISKNLGEMVIDSLPFTR